MKFSENLIKNTDNIKEKTFIWNILASTLNAGLSAVLLIGVTRISGVYEAGIFAIAFSIAQLMLTIGFFDMRAYQSTDIDKPISFKYYLSFRIITCSMMIVASVLWVYFGDYSNYKKTLIVLMCFLKMLDALEDVMHGFLQQNRRLDIAAKLQTMRISITMGCFLIVLYLTKSLFYTLIITTIFSFTAILILNIPVIVNFTEVKLDFNYKFMKELFLACFPLFIGSYLTLYLGNAPKYAIDRYMSSEYQTYFGILFLPSFVINLFSGFIFRPVLTSLAEDWAKNERKKYTKKIIQLIVWGVGLTIIVFIGTYILGIPLLSFIYNINLVPYKRELLILIIGGGFNALNVILYYALTVMRKQNYLLFGYLITAIFAFFTAPNFVRHQGIFGAALAYLFSNILMNLIFALTYYKVLKNNTTTN